jgi:transitional endoplasmic reticulum ATPase
MTSDTKSVDRVRKEALAALAQLGGATTTEDDIVFEGKKIILPATFEGDLAKVIKFLMKRREDEDSTYEFHRTFRYRPNDGAVATGVVLKRLFGMTLGKAIQTMFRKIPPQVIDVEVGAGETEQAPWGAMELPGMDDSTLYLDSTMDEELGWVFQLHGEAPRKYRKHVEGLFNAIQYELETNSIYRGKAISGQEVPKFLDLSSIDPESIIYSETVVEQLTANVWTPIEKAEALADLGEPGKRAVLFEGPYGTGKTMGAYLTAQRAVEAGWTFLMARPGRDDLEQVLQTARMYQPAVVFTEDVDNLASANAGTSDHMSKVLDLFDGLDTKGLRLMLVLTTNNVEDLHPGMLRPGRLDAVVSIGSLDLSGVRKLTEYVIGTKLRDDIDWEKVYEANESYTPAFVREGLGRVVRYAVARGDNTEVSTEDLVGAAEGLRHQYELMVAANADPDAKPEFVDIVEKAVQDAIDGNILLRRTHRGNELVVADGS